jgi:hypothetical protein
VRQRPDHDTSYPCPIPTIAQNGMERVTFCLLLRHKVGEDNSTTEAQRTQRNTEWCELSRQGSSSERRASSRRRRGMKRLVRYSVLNLYAPVQASPLWRETLRTVLVPIDFRNQRFGKVVQAVPDKPCNPLGMVKTAPYGGSAQVRWCYSRGNPGRPEGRPHRDPI